MVNSGVLMRPPDECLAPFVSHYWLIRENLAPTYTALPDGCIDIVIEATESVARGWVYGTTTRRTEIPVDCRRHYLGIRFKPGQSRHFVAVPARDLTDHHVPARDVLGFSLDRIAERVASGGVFSELDAVLTAWLTKRPPQPNNRVDVAVRAIESLPGCARIDDLAERLGVSRRQLERLFLDQVGVSPKLYAMFERCHRAMRSLSGRSRISLADAALEIGYADQSHMTRELMRLAGETPARLLRRNVAFLQETPT